MAEVRSVPSKAFVRQGTTQSVASNAGSPTPSRPGFNRQGTNTPTPSRPGFTRQGTANLPKVGKATKGDALQLQPSLRCELGPDDPPPYGDPNYSSTYWDARHAGMGDLPYDWYMGYDRLAGILTLRLPPPSSAPEILEIGFGTSELPSCLHADGWTNVTAIDTSVVAVTRARSARRHTGRSELQFLQMDACKTEFPQKCFDAVIDKALLDTVVTGGYAIQKGQELLSEVYRLLRPGGVYFCISHSAPSTRLPYLTHDSSKPWRIEVARVSKSRAPQKEELADDMDDDPPEDFHIYICTKPPITQPLSEIDAENEEKAAAENEQKKQAYDEAAATLKNKFLEDFPEQVTETEINLSNHRFQNEEIFYNLTVVLPYFSDLQVLNLAENWLDAAKVSALASKITSLKKLQELVLRHNRIGDAGAKQIAEALPSMPKLVKVDLSSNTIGPDGMEALSSAFTRLANLRQLRLADNQITDAGAITLAQTLPAMGNLEELWVVKNSITDASANKISAAIMKLRHFKRLVIQEEDMEEEEHETLTFFSPRNQSPRNQAEEANIAMF